MAEQWQQKDTLRQMTSKFNQAVDELEEFKDSSNHTNQETSEKFNIITEDITEILSQLESKIESKPADDEIEYAGEPELGEFGKYYENSPVSKPQQAAIDAAKNEVLEAVSDRLTSEEIDAGEFTSEDIEPTVSEPVKTYINTKVQEVFGSRDSKATVVDNKLVIVSNDQGLVGYGISQPNNVGVVKPSEDIKVNPKTGKMTIPDLPTIKQNLKYSLEGTAEVARMVGNLNKLNTDTKTTLVGAINEVIRMSNEVFQLGNEKKAKLVETLIAVGISCSTSDSWDELFNKILTLRKEDNV